MGAAQLDQMSSERIADKAMQHCVVAQSVRVGERAVTKDGHVVKRTSSSEWVLIQAAANDNRYEAGSVVPGRVLFWRMNGLERRLGV